MPKAKDWQHDGHFPIGEFKDIHIKRRLNHGWEFFLRVADPADHEKVKKVKDTIQIEPNDMKGLRTFLERNNLGDLERALIVRMRAMLTKGKEGYLAERGMHPRRR